MAPPKRAPGELGTVARNRNRFRVQVRLSGITGTGPLRTTEADARADLVLVRACQTREEIPAFLALLRAEAAPMKFGTVVPNHRRPLGGARRGKSQDEDEERPYKRCMTAWNAFVAENSGGQLRSSRPVYDLSEQPVSQLAT